jgi:hypothetical protein
MENEQHQKLYMPNNVKTRSEFFNGFGFTELYQAIGIVLIVGGISVLAFLIHGNLPILILSILIICAVAVTILTKDATNQSVIDYTKHMIHFAHIQKTYPYHYNQEDFK